MQCHNCSTELTDDSLYCAHCGSEAHHAIVSNELPFSAEESSAPRVALSGRALTAVVAREQANLSGALVPHSAVGGLRRLNAYSVHSLLTQANLHRIRGQFTEAIDCCVAVLRVQSGNATAHSLLGDIYRDQNKLDDAIQWYRMAVELRPNPADTGKLAEMERLRRNGDGTARAQRARSSADGRGSLAAATGLDTGTSNLMGVSPRRWLRGIWVTSLAFLSVVLIGLIAMQSQRHDVASRSGKTQATGVGFGTGINPNTPALQDLNRRATSSSLQPSGGPLGTRGALSTAQLSRMAERSAVLPPAGPLAPNIPTAPVLDVKPFDSGAPATGQAPRDHSSGVDSATIQPLALTGNLALLQVQNLGNNTAGVMVAAPRELAADAGDTARELLVRNVFRAARTAFAGNSLYTRATVFIQTEIPAAGGEVVLMEASLDRTAAAEALADTDPLESLIARLQGLKWAAPAAAASAPAADAPAMEITVHPGK